SMPMRDPRGMIDSMPCARICWNGLGSVRVRARITEERPAARLYRDKITWRRKRRGGATLGSRTVTGRTGDDLYDGDDLYETTCPRLETTWPRLAMVCLAMACPRLATGPVRFNPGWLPDRLAHGSSLLTGME